MLLVRMLNIIKLMLILGQVRAKVSFTLTLRVRTGIRIEPPPLKELEIGKKLKLF